MLCKCVIRLANCLWSVFSQTKTWQLSSSRRWQLFEEVKRQDLLDLRHDVLNIFLGVGVEVVRVWPSDAEGREEPVKVLEVGDRLACEDEVRALHRVVVGLNMRILSKLLVMKFLNQTNRRVTRVAEVHQLCDPRDVRNKFVQDCWIVVVSVDDVRRAVVVLAADERPSVHLEVRKRRCG